MCSSVVKLSIAVTFIGLINLCIFCGFLMYCFPNTIGYPLYKYRFDKGWGPEPCWISCTNSLSDTYIPDDIKKWIEYFPKFKEKDIWKEFPNYEESIESTESTHEPDIIYY